MSSTSMFSIAQRFAELGMTSAAKDALAVAAAAERNQREKITELAETQRKRQQEAKQESASQSSSSVDILQRRRDLDTLMVRITKYPELLNDLNERATPQDRDLIALSRTDSTMARRIAVWRNLKSRLHQELVDSHDNLLKVLNGKMPIELTIWGTMIEVAYSELVKLDISLTEMWVLDLHGTATRSTDLKSYGFSRSLNEVEAEVISLSKSSTGSIEAVKELDKNVLDLVGKIMQAIKGTK